MGGPLSVVTGACGFVGSHLCERLLDAGHRVVGIDAFTDSYEPAVKRENLAALSGRPGFTLAEGHLVELDLRDILDGASYVFHMAARAGVRGGWGGVFDAYVRDNLTSTQRLLEALRDRNSVRQVILASTSSVYGHDPPLPTPETAGLSPESYYAVTKVACEMLARAYLRHFGVPVTVLRFYSLYGPRQRPDMGFHIFIRALLEDREITVYGDGNQTREVTYVADAVEATFLSMGEDRIGETFNIGGGTHKSLNEYLAEIEQVAGKKFHRRHAPMVKGDQLHSHADTTKAASALGFRPRFPLRAGIEAELRWLEERIR